MFAMLKRLFFTFQVNCLPVVVSLEHWTKSTTPIKPLSTCVKAVLGEVIGNVLELVRSNTMVSLERLGV